MGKNKGKELRAQQADAQSPAAEDMMSQTQPCWKW